MIEQPLLAAVRASATIPEAIIALARFELLLARPQSETFESEFRGLLDDWALTLKGVDRAEIEHLRTQLIRAALSPIDGLDLRASKRNEELAR